MSKNYDDFLQRMRNLGYTIRAKTSKGEWLKHINFIPPNSPSGARGYRDTNKLLAGYTRQEVTERIAALQKMKTAHREQVNYTHDDIDEVQPSRRRNGKPRNQLDKLLASEIQRLNREINVDFYSAFKRTKQLPPVT
ncbi:MAG TPA: hypothetical protein DEP65_13630 [Ruminococcus sp.]|nr:hypothetical protein [Ruminococcus sp.]